jgi:hypothetical protein
LCAKFRADLGQAAGSDVEDQLTQASDWSLIEQKIILISTDRLHWLYMQSEIHIGTRWDMISGP